jgi:hypothetical protein
VDSQLAALVGALAARQDGCATIAQALRLGVTASEVDSELRSGRWHALLRGTYLVDAELYAAGVPERAWWRAALLAHGPDTCLVAGTAARLLGLHGLPATQRTVEIAWVGGMPRQRRRSASPPSGLAATARDVIVRQLPVRPDEVVTVNGFPIRRGDLTVIDAGLDLDRGGMLSILDSGLHLGICTREQMDAAILAARCRPGVQQLRALALVADGRAESTVESRVRLACIDDGVAPDDLQYVVRDRDGHVVAIGDLGWHRHRRRPLLAEADGESVHSAPRAVYRDRTRGNALAAQACDTVRFTFADALRPRYVTSVVRAALLAA